MFEFFRLVESIIHRFEHLICALFEFLCDLEVACVHSLEQICIIDFKLLNILQQVVCLALSNFDELPLLLTVLDELFDFVVAFFESLDLLLLAVLHLFEGLLEDAGVLDVVFTLLSAHVKIPLQFVNMMGSLLVRLL